VLKDKAPEDYELTSKALIARAWEDSSEYRGKTKFVEVLTPIIVNALKERGVYLQPTFTNVLKSWICQLKENTLTPSKPEKSPSPTV
jgi:hypothetical protein